MTEYGKLVRDNIPEIIKANGENPIFREVKDTEEYRNLLLNKLSEETKELAQNPSIEEIADCLEVLQAITIVYGFDMAEIEKTRQEKHHTNGGFEKRIFLEKVDQ